MEANNKKPTVKTIPSIKYDKDSFQGGVNDFSDVCGGMAAMINLGVTPDKAVDYFMQILRVQADVEIARCNLDTILEQLGCVDKDCKDDECEDL